MSQAARIPLSVLIGAKPDLMRQSLQTFLRGVLAIQEIRLADDSASTLVDNHLYRPDVVILDANLSAEVIPELVKQLRTENPALNCIVLVDTVQQQKLFMTIGIQHVLLKGFLNEHLAHAVLENLNREPRTLKTKAV
jgi:DNA-binding NarL/FixJ family response regulator